MPCSHGRTVKKIISCSQTISISGKSPKSSRSLNIIGNSSRSATAVPPSKPMKAGSCSPMASGLCASIASAPYCLTLKIQQKSLPAWDDPLLAPHEKEREGYVPNVVYSCGALIHNNELVIPYAMSDINSGIATVDVGELIHCMHAVA